MELFFVILIAFGMGIGVGNHGKNIKPGDERAMQGGDWIEDKKGTATVKRLEKRMRKAEIIIQELLNEGKKGRK